jgi:hypothetical protein
MACMCGAAGVFSHVYLQYGYMLFRLHWKYLSKSVPQFRCAVQIASADP